MTEPRQIAGDIQHADEAETNGELMDFAVEAEETVWLSNGDKLRVRKFVDDAVLAIDKARMKPCRWYQFECKRSNQRRALND